MPRLKRRSKQSAPAVLDYKLEVLTRGIPRRRTDEGLAFMSDEVAQREVWEPNRVAVLRWWIATNPGTRPAAWWRFDSPEPRRRVAGLEGAEREQQWAEMRESWPALFDRPTRFKNGIPDPGLWGDEFEPESDYLGRLGLLTPAERDVLSREDDGCQG